MIFARNLASLIAWWVILWAVVGIYAARGNSAAKEERPIPLVICDRFRGNCAQALKIAWCESRLRPRAVSSTRDVGLFQINYRAHHHPGESFSAFEHRFFDVRRNISFAYRLSRGGRDWHPWTCRWVAS